MKRTEFVLVILLFFTSLYSGVAGLGNNTLRNSSQKTDYLNKLPPETKFEQHTVIVKFALVHKNSLSKSSVNLPSLSPAFVKYGVNRTTQMYPLSEQMISSNGAQKIFQYYLKLNMRNPKSFIQFWVYQMIRCMHSNGIFKKSQPRKAGTLQPAIQPLLLRS